MRFTSRPVCSDVAHSITGQACSRLAERVCSEDEKEDENEKAFTYRPGLCTA